MNDFKPGRRGPPNIGGTFKVVNKTVRLTDGRTIEFDVKVCRPQRSVEQQVYSLCHARMSGCVHNIPRHQT